MKDLEKKIASVEILLGHKFTGAEKARIKAFFEQKNRYNNIHEAGNRFVAYAISIILRGSVLVLVDTVLQLTRELGYLKQLKFTAKTCTEADKYYKFLLDLCKNYPKIDFSLPKAIMLLTEYYHDYDLESLGLPLLITQNNADSNYLGLKKLTNLQTLKGHLKAFCKKQLTAGKPGVVWCKTVKQAEEIFHFLKKASVNTCLYTAKSKTTIEAGEPFVVVATSALAFKNEYAIEWSYCFLYPAGYSNLIDILTITNGPCIIGIASDYGRALSGKKSIRKDYSVYYSNQEQPEFMQERLVEDFLEWEEASCSCYHEALWKVRAGFKKSPYAVEGGCWNCSKCYKRDPSKFARVRLLKWREETALNEGLPPAFVLTNQEIERIVSTAPQTVRDLRTIKGIKTVKSRKYGSQILACIKPLEDL